MPILRVEVTVGLSLALTIALGATHARAQTPPPEIAPRGGAEVTVGTVTFQGPSGGLDPLVIGSVVRGGSEAYLDCYVPVLRALPTLSGEVQVNVTLAHTGHPTDVTTTDLANAADVSQCVGRAVRALSLPHFAQHDPVHFRVSVTFRPPAAERGIAEPPSATSTQHVGVAGLNHEVIRQTLRTYRSAVDHCVSRASEANPNFAGQVILRFTVAPDGHVSDAGIVEAATDLAPAASCIASAALSWTFPAPMGGQPFTFEHPFRFNAVGN